MRLSPREQLLNGADLVHLVGREVAFGPIGRAVVDLEGVRSVLFLPLRQDGNCSATSPLIGKKRPYSPTNR